jgi:uncharacterized protein
MTRAPAVVRTAVRTRAAALLVAVAAVALAVAPPATAAPPFGGADYVELYIDMPDETRLHADVLRAAGTGWDAEQPVILTVSPYTNHNGSTDDVSPLGGDGPNTRFNDFLALTGALDEGYTYALVDLPGFGGSSGCNDWGGLREQVAVRAAVEFFADAAFSTGRVGMIGKSYDGWTGLMGMAQDPDGLAAVVSMEPVYSGYRYMFLNGVPRGNEGATGTMLNFQRYDAKPGALNDDPEYLVNGLPGATQPLCYAENLTEAENHREGTPYWTERDLVRLARGSDVPLFLTQGFLETNTEPDAAFDFWAAMDGSSGHNRAWFGQFDHIRGWDRDGGDPLNTSARLSAGREGFAEEVMAFFDEHLRGIEPDEALPPVVVQDGRGDYRAEDAWPPADSRSFTTALPSAVVVDQANNGDGTGSGRGAWAVGQVLDDEVRLAGEPRLSAVVTTAVADLDLAVNVYDVDEEAGVATLVSRGTTRLEGAGSHDLDLQLFGQDWVFEPGHRIAVLISGGNGDWWSNSSTGSTFLVGAPEVTLPLLTEPRTAFLDGGSTSRLEQHLRTGTIPLSAVDLDAEVELALP